MSEPTQKEIEMALEDADIVILINKNWHQDRAFKILASAYRALKKSHAQEIEKLKGELAKHRLSCTCDDDSDEPCSRHHLWMREQNLRMKAEAALKAKEDELSRCLKALDSEEGKHRLTQGELEWLEKKNIKAQSWVIELGEEKDRAEAALSSQAATYKAGLLMAEVKGVLWIQDFLPSGSERLGIKDQIIHLVAGRANWLQNKAFHAQPDGE